MEIPFFFCTSLRTYDTTSDILRMYSAQKKTIYVNIVYMLILQ